MRLLPVSRYWGVVVVGLGLLVGLVGSGCDKLETTEGAGSTVAESATAVPLEEATTTEIPVLPTETSIPTTAAPPASTPTTASLSSAEERLPSGNIKALGFIRSVWGDASGRHLTIDYVDRLTADEAVAAGIVDPEDAHDGFWYSNVNPMLREFAVSESADIFTTYRGRIVSPDPLPCTWADFLSFWDSPPPPDNEYMCDELWWIERDGDTIVWIMQQFIP